MRRIFIQIASYRDPELPRTIKSCLSRAQSPHQLSFGICHQYDEETRSLLDEWMNGMSDRFRVILVPWKESRGVGYARHLCQTLYRKEEYTLQIDSHMRFVQNWDDIVIKEWSRYAATTPTTSLIALTEYATPFRYVNGIEVFESHSPNILVINSIDHGFVRTFKSGSLLSSRAKFAAGGFLFGPGLLCTVPYESSVCFTGEELLLSYNLFRRGWHLYAPMTPIVYHLYDRPEAIRFWTCQSNYPELLETSLKTLRQTFLDSKEPDILTRFESFTGIHFDCLRNDKLQPQLNII